MFLKGSKNVFDMPLEFILKIKEPSVNGGKKINKDISIININGIEVSDLVKGQS